LTQIYHDGCDVTRSQKVDRVAQTDAALSVLRVCFKEYTTFGAAYNCGTCEKCVRTMVDLRIAGVVGTMPHLPKITSPEIRSTDRFTQCKKERQLL